MMDVNLKWLRNKYIRDSRKRILEKKEFINNNIESSLKRITENASFDFEKSSERELFLNLLVFDLADELSKLKIKNLERK